MQETGCELVVPFVAMHPDWQLMLDVLYMFIPSQCLSTGDVAATQPFLSAELGNNLTFLVSNRAAQTTAAALFCCLEQQHGKQNIVGQGKLEPSDVRFMDKVLMTMYFVLTVGS